MPYKIELAEKRKHLLEKKLKNVVEKIIELKPEKLYFLAHWLKINYAKRATLTSS